MKRIKDLLNIYSIVAVLSLFILTYVLELWKADLGVPLADNGGDTLFNLMSIKGLNDSGWYFHNKWIGAPFGGDFYDLPMADSFHLILLKMLVILFDSATALNLYFIAIFPLNAVSTCFVLRCLKISRSVSIVISLLYAFLPYPFLRGEAHLFLAAYYTVPLITLVILSLWSNNLPLISSKQNSKIKLDWSTITSRKSLFCIAVCIVLGSTGVYYAFFSCIFITVASISAFIYRRDKNIFLSALILMIIISISFFINILPTLVYTYQHGVNREVAWRDIIEAEVYGLKITNLLLPIQNSRFSIYTNSIKEYQQVLSRDETLFVALGMIGSGGFLSLVFRSLFLSSQTDRKNYSPSIYDHLALLNISAFLFATVGGFGTMFALLVTPLIRGTNRISIFIAFFSLLTVALFLDSIKKKYIKNSKNKFIFNLFLVSGLLLGILNQTSPTFIPKYSVQKNDYKNDQSFVHTIERILPANSMVFQLPYVPFPENKSETRMSDYDLFRGYLHSKRLKWSYGAIKGRNSSWHQLISEEPVDVLLPKISMAGFNGIYIDRYGYRDNENEKKIEMELENKLGVKPIISGNGRLIFFDMELFNKELRSRYNPEQIKAYRWIILNPIAAEWRDGFYGEEYSEKEGKWRWADKQGTLIINNPQSEAKRIKVSMSLQTLWPEYSNLKIESEFFSEVVRINKKKLVFEKDIVLRPGTHTIRFYSDAQQFKAPKDSRNLFFKVLNFKIQERIFEEDLKLDKLNSIEVEWKEGFYNLELISGGKWRWCDKQGTLIINNPTSKARETKLSMALATDGSDYSNLRMESDLFSEVIRINKKESVFEKTILLPPGKHAINFSSDAQPANNAPGDTRRLFFRINDVIF